MKGVGGTCCFTPLRNTIFKIVPSAEPGSPAFREKKQELWVGFRESTGYYSSGPGTSRSKTQATPDSIRGDSLTPTCQASPYTVRHSSVGTAWPLQIRKLRPECSHSGDTFGCIRSDLTRFQDLFLLPTRCPQTVLLLSPWKGDQWPRTGGVARET